MHAKIVERVLGYLQENSLFPMGIVNAPIRKGKNIEYILYIKQSFSETKSHSEIISTVKELVKQNSLGVLY